MKEMLSETELLTRAISGEKAVKHKQKNRDTTDTVAEILELCKHEQKKTHIMYGANMSFAALDLILPGLEDSGVLVRRKDENGADKFYITESGMEFIEHSLALRRILKLPEDEPLSKTFRQKLDSLAKPKRERKPEKEVKFAPLF